MFFAASARQTKSFGRAVNDRSHPGPLLQGEGESSTCPLKNSRAGNCVAASRQSAAIWKAQYAKHAEVTVRRWMIGKRNQKNSQRNAPPKLPPVDFRSPLTAIGQSN